MDHFSSYAAAGNACEAEEERMDNEAARLEELDRQAAEQARHIVNDDRVTPEMVEAVSFAMDGGDDERNLIAVILAHFDMLIDLPTQGAVAEHVRYIMHAIAPVRTKIIASETRRIREKMEPTLGRPSTVLHPGWVFIDRDGDAWGTSYFPTGRACKHVANGPFATEQAARDQGTKCAFGCVSVVPWTSESRVPARKEEKTP